MHDSINKFCAEYDGILLQSYNIDTFDPLLLPFRLMRMKGGVDVHDTVDLMMVAISVFIDIKDHAFCKVCSLEFENVLKKESNYTSNYHPFTKWKKVRFI